MSKEFRKVTHCLFDLDGLLLNTENIYTNITQQIIGEQGSTEKYTGDFKVTLMGLHAIESVTAIVERYKLPISPNQYLDRFQELSQTLMPTAELMPGVEKLLRHLSSHKIPIALATSSSKEMYDLKTTRHSKIFDIFDHKVYGSSDDHVKRGKPAPDIFIVAAGRFPDQPDPSQCLVFEDAPNGVEAAIAAGCQVVMVPEDYVTEDLRKEATLVVSSLEDFKPELFGLPPFE